MDTTVLWIFQILTALVFVMAGLIKATQPKAKLASNMGWVEDFSQGQVRLIGILEVLGALGVVLPVLLNVLPWLTPIAAAGLVITMIGAAIVHLRRKEYPMIGVNVVLGALAAVVFVGHLPLLSM
jgi:uncharacterized membrane protein YphA (DoxX/SURF4 family)